MTSSFSNNKAARLKESRGLRAKAPIAAQFEDCVQAFQQLSDSLQVKLSRSSLKNISRECNARLSLWANESGASSRLLDYALRESPTLKRQTLQLLEDLFATLKDVIAEVLLQDAGEAVGDSEDSIDNVRDEATVEKFEPSSFLDDPIFSLEPVDAEVGVEAEAEALLSEAEDIVAALSQLMPALRDPFERHEDEKTSSAKSPTNDASKELYTEIAQVLFPDASEALADQFGALNVQRLRGISCIRDVGKKSRAHRQSNARQASKGLNSLIGLSGQSEFAQQTSWPVLQESARAESDGGTSTIRSHADLLSKSPSLGQTTATSVSGDAGELAILQYLVPPSVPVDLSKEEQFECPYCQSNLPLTFSTEPMVDQDWIEHVYHDLKPYVCTFDGCVHQQRPTGDRHQWFLHELSHHRLQPVWTCGMCRESFECARGFDSHLETSHPSLSDDSWRFLGVNCKGYCHEKPPLLRCNLCPKIADDLADLERHVGRHLEAFALTALFRNDLPDEGPLSKTGLLDEYFQGLGDLQHIAPDMAKSRDEDHSDASTINASNATDVDEAVDSADVPSPFALASNPATDGSEKVLEFLDRQKPQEPTMSVRTGIPDRYDNFVGRIEDLEAMYGHLSAPGRVCTISGRGGIGKTALGVEYVHKYGPEYPHVFWVESDNPGIGAEKYGNIATTLKLAEKPLTTEDTRTFLVREYLTTSETRWLLIFDNVASWKDVSRYIPRTLAKTKGSILITTRTGPLLPIGPAHPIYHRQHAVELNVWPLQHAREFLLTSISPKMGKEAVQSHEESDLATQVVEVVGRLPLAVSMIVGYIKVSRCTLSDFLEMWAEKEHNTKKKRKRRMDIDSSDIDSTIDSLWTIGIREVRMNSRRLLDVLSFLDSDTIHKHLLVGDHKEEYLEFLNSSETISYKRMIHELSGRRLVTVKQLPNSGEAYSIHRLLQQKVLLDMEDLGFVDAYRKAFRLIRKKFPRANPQQVPTPSSWPICSDYMRHVFTLHRVHCQNAPSAPMMDMDPADIAKLFYDAGFYIWSSQTNSYDGLSFLKTAAKILEDSGHDENSRIRADILCVHGLQLLNMGCVERAQGPKLLERALKIRKRLYEENRASRDDDVLHQNAANDYALCLLNEHEFDRAGEIIRSCRERYLYWGTEDSNPWENSKYYGNYSIVLMWKGELDMAITYQEKSLQLMEQSVAGRSTQYYRRAYMLGCYLLQKEDLEGALEKHLEVLTARLEMQGKHHAHTMMSMYAVGAMYHHLGKPNMAIQYLQQCLETVNSSWWDRAAIGRAQYHLAILYREQGFDEEAAAELEGRADAFLEEFQEYIPEAVRDSGDKLMIFDDLQPTFLGRYTGVKLLKHLQEQHRAKLAESSN